MRIGVVWQPGANAYYRAIDPVRSMARRGHDVVGPADERGLIDVERLAVCDVVHVFRRIDEPSWKALGQLERRGVGITYDNDDDLTNLPKESPDYAKQGGAKGRQIFLRSAEAARRARVFTTTSEALAEHYRTAGVQRIEVIPNALAPDIARPRHEHDGIVIGWVAAWEHRADAARIGIRAALNEILAKHPDVRVHCIGVDLQLRERCRHERKVPYEQVAGRMGGWDIGIAPLADHPFNLSRSDIKLKEYAASGLAWLASPVGPYRNLGEAEGGRLVADDGWFEALDRLVANAQERRALAQNAASWAAASAIDKVAHRWEAVFAEAAGRPVVPSPGSGRPRMVVRLPAQSR